MRFSTVAFALTLVTTSLAAAVPRADPVEVKPISLIQAYSQKNWKGDKIEIATDKDVTDHPASDSSTATCFNVEHNFISSVTMAAIQGAPFTGMRPYGCQLYAEDNCQGEWRWIQQATWVDVARLMDFDNFDFDKRTSSLKCWLTASW